MSGIQTTAKWGIGDGACCLISHHFCNISNDHLHAYVGLDCHGDGLEFYSFESCATNPSCYVSPSH